MIHADTCCSMEEAWKCCSEWIKLITEDHTLYDSSSMKYRESNWCYHRSGGLGGNGGAVKLWMCMGFLWGKWWICSKIDYSGGCTILNALKTIKLYTLNGWNIWHINFISVKLSLKDMTTVM